MRIYFAAEIEGGRAAGRSENRGLNFVVCGHILNKIPFFGLVFHKEYSVHVRQVPYLNMITCSNIGF